MALSAKAHNVIFTVLSRRHLHCPHCYRPLSSSSSPLPTATRPPVDPYRGHFAHPGQSSRVIKKPTFPNLSSLQETNANFFFDSENQLTDLRSRSRIWDPPVPQECPRSDGIFHFSQPLPIFCWLWKSSNWLSKSNVGFSKSNFGFWNSNFGLLKSKLRFSKSKFELN